VSIVLLDSDAVIDFLFGIDRSVRLIRSLFERGDTLCLCDVVLAEVYSGLRPDHREKAASVLAGFPFLATSAEAARQAGIWRFDFARQGVALATSDVMIAATAFDHGARLLTGNVAHYPMGEITVEPLPRTDGNPERRTDRA